ncbi:hypothetical protein ACK3TF_000427 [Chlorella vulgaris]
MTGCRPLGDSSGQCAEDGGYRVKAIRRRRREPCPPASSLRLRSSLSSCHSRPATQISGRLPIYRRPSPPERVWSAFVAYVILLCKQCICKGKSHGGSSCPYPQEHVLGQQQEASQALRVAEANKTESDDGFLASATAGILPVIAAVVVASNGSMLQAMQAARLGDKAISFVSAHTGSVGPTALLTFGFMKLQGLAQGNRSKQKALTLACEQLEKAEQLVIDVQQLLCLLQLLTRKGRQVLPRRSVASSAYKEEATGGEYRAPIIVRVVLDNWLDYLSLGCICGIYFFVFKLAPEGWGWPLFIFVTVSHFSVFTLQRMREYDSAPPGTFAHEQRTALEKQRPVSSRQVLLRRSVASNARKEEATGGEYRAPIIVRVVLDNWLEYLLFAAYSGIYFFLFKLAPEGWGWPLFIFVTVSHFSVLTLQRMREYDSAPPGTFAHEQRTALEKQRPVSSRQVLLRRSVASNARKEEATGGEYRAPIIVRVVLDNWLEYLLFAAYSGIYFFLFKLAPEGWGWPLFIFVTVSHFSVLTLQRMREYDSAPPGTFAHEQRTALEKQRPVSSRQVLPRRSVASSAYKEEATGGEYRAPIIVRVVLDNWLDYLSLGCICGIYFFVFKLVPEGWGWPLFIFVTVSHFSAFTLQRMREYE